MVLQIEGAAKRLILSLLLACGAAGCAVYGPPYAAYGAPYGATYGGAYGGAYGNSVYPGYSYDGGYPYAAPAYAYPPLTLGLGFSYHDRGERYHGHRGHRGHHGWGDRHRAGNAWRGGHGGRRHHDGGHGRRRR